MAKSSCLTILMVLFLVATGNSASFTAHGDGTVTDHRTQLMWQQEDNNSETFWQEALDYCNDLVLGG